ncbi:sugar ABC transporter substrate-binding protein [Paenibacillus sp.]|uniref:ABC transporter substrate-binding protein n=1 Tax=Paenibacillus sp. TaxID=58172 RepID=UPI002D290DAE|nr:sugar ABC transporter substrate-binding protein [Paenibacillus sp.]HZG56798.1 sugar ABC transporter substrate-binding protein [Paenibacillus sp.]
MSKRKLVTSLLLAVAMLTAACSTQSTGGKGASSGETVTIRFVDWEGEEAHKQVEKMLKTFEEQNPGIKVDYQSVPYDQYLTKLNSQAASNTLPDIAQMPEGQVLQWAQKGVLMDLSAILDGAPSKLETNKFKTPDGKTVGISVANEIILMFYSKKMFDDAGLPYPPAEVEKAWTWEEMVEVARKLTKDVNGKHPGEAGFDPENIAQYGINIPKLDFMWAAFAKSNGGGVVSKDGKELLVDTPETIEALQKIADLTLVEHVSPSVSQSTSLPDLAARMLTGKVAMNIDGQWATQSFEVTEGLEYGIGVLPKFKKAVTVNAGGADVIFNSTKHPDEAAKLLQFLLDPNNSLPQIQSGLWMPNEERWYTEPDLIAKWIDNDAHVEEYKTAVVDYALKATEQNAFFIVPNAGEISDVLGPGLDPVWLGEKTAEEAMKNDIAPKVREIFNSGE